MFSSASGGPCSGDARGQLAECADRVLEGALLPHRVDERVRRVHAERSHLPLPDQHLAGEGDAGTQGVGRDGGNARRDLAGNRAG